MDSTNNYNTNEELSQVLFFMADLKKLNKNINKSLVSFFSEEKQQAKAERVKKCANYITFKRYFDDDSSTKLYKINLCRERLCPNCSTALARRKFKELYPILEEYKETLIFSTLTTDNITGYYLRETLQKMQKSFKKMIKKLKISLYFRSFEVTYNPKTDKYHPHIHFIAQIKDKRNIAQKIKLTWAECLHEQIHTRFPYVETKTYKSVNEQSIMELCKYITKPTDINPITIKYLNNLAGLQLKRGSKAVTNIIKENREAAKATAEEEEKRLDTYGYELLEYIWNDENYITP